MNVAFAAPTAATWAAHLDRSRGEALGVAPGSTDGPCPRGMATNAGGARVGTTAADFVTARAALFALAMFDLRWMRAQAAAPLDVGVDIAVSGRALGLWWTNVCRITRIVDEPRRAGFTYATVRSHMMAGEERFVVERRDDGVWFELLAHARPACVPARLGWPLVRAMQRRFAQQAPAAIAAAVRRAGGRA